MKQIIIALMLSVGIGTHLIAQNPIEKLPSQFYDNGTVTLHYKVVGNGYPIVFLHGALLSMNDWEKQYDDFAGKYKLIFIDSRGHGKSSFSTEPLSYNVMADDVISLLDHLKIDKAAIVGFSDGGNIGMSMCLRYPERVSKLVAIGSNYKVDDSSVHADILQKVREWDTEKMAEKMKQTQASNPTPELFPDFVKQMQNMLLTQPNLNEAQLQSIECPVLFLVSDHDFIKISHTVEMFELVKKAYLCVIPGAKHYNIKDNPKVVNASILKFLKEDFIDLSQ